MTTLLKSGANRQEISIEEMPKCLQYAFIDIEDERFMEHNGIDLKGIAPMSVCNAMSQGYIGFDLQNAIRTELLNRGIYKPVSTIITQVRVDPFDKAFHNPSKVIGRYMTKEEADIEEHKGNYVTYEETENGKGYRRIIASPQPIDIYEIDAIKALIAANQLVFCLGGILSKSFSSR